MYSVTSTGLFIFCFLLVASAVFAGQEESSPPAQPAKVDTLPNDANQEVAPPQEDPPAQPAKVDTLPNDGNPEVVSPQEEQPESANPVASELAPEAKPSGQDAPLARVSTEPESDPLNTILIVFITLTALLCIVCGGLLGYLLLLRSRERHFAGLRERVLAGSEQVPLLTDEAIRMIADFRKQLEDHAVHFKGGVDEHRTSVEQLINQAQELAQTSHSQTHDTVTSFKGSLNAMLDGVQKFMGKVVEDTKKTRDESTETKEYTKNVAEVLREKEGQLAELERGYQISLLGPLTKEFLKVRDELIALQSEESNPELRQQLKHLDERILHALDEIDIVEITVPDRPMNNLDTHLWETVGAAFPTDDPEKHETVERVQLPGYAVRTPGGQLSVIRKAVIALYAHGAAERPTFLEDEQSPNA